MINLSDLKPREQLRRYNDKMYFDTQRHMDKLIESFRQRRQ